MTWTTVTASTVAWAVVSPFPEVASDGVDFQLRFHESYPMLLREDRPLLMQSSLSEGQP